MPKIDLITTRCAICQTQGSAAQLYPANVGVESFIPAIYSARRMPDRIHFRLAKCCNCGLVRSDPIIAHELMSQLYAQSAFTYGNQVADLRRTYGRYLAKLKGFNVSKDSLLEIGCGDGFFLKEAQAQGYRKVQGVEPSTSAIEHADPALREHIICGLMTPGIFESCQFDVICMFQVFDHIPDPGVLLDECFRLLKPEGFMLCINHNIDSVSARVLGERSPIIDVEHTYLYSTVTMARIFGDHGFTIREKGSVWNTYNFSYLAQLLPLPSSLKRGLLGGLNNSPLGRIRLSAPLGNLFLIAQKPSTPISDGKEKL